MENKNFKSVAFGGFDKEDVIGYIQKTAQENADAQEALQRENSGLQGETAALKEELEGLKTQVEQLTAERDRLQALAQRETAAREKLERERGAWDACAAEAERLRPQAEAYQKIKDQVGDIECQARKRASDLESATLEKLDGMVTALRRRHEDLAGAFHTAADHMSGELRKLEVGLTQLPLALDQAGSDLKELESALCAEKGKSE